MSTTSTHKPREVRPLLNVERRELQDLMSDVLTCLHGHEAYTNTFNRVRLARSLLASLEIVNSQPATHED